MKKIGVKNVNTHFGNKFQEKIKAIGLREKFQEPDRNSVLEKNVMVRRSGGTKPKQDV